ncbi:MAG: enoyl-CoA hydratase/isomerase family protein [Hyphomicrobiales bacterium]|nr:enoyl-CoA hydratase/isomerase family protein [Hyphomicrobiales bacterium]
MADDLLVQSRGPALWLTINREERRNALSPEVVRGLAQHIEAADRERSHRLVVITGAGSKAFCAGADLQSGSSFAFDHSEPVLGFARLLRSAHACTIPLVARVNGSCMAGGMGLLAMCDLAVSTEAAMFGLPEVKVGVFPAQVLALLRTILPARTVAEMCLTGEQISAAEAKAIGLVNHVAADVDQALEKLVECIVAASPAALRRGRYMLKAIEGMTFEQAIAFAESQIALFAQTEDAREGKAAFQEKRKPNWTGR